MSDNDIWYLDIPPGWNSSKLKYRLVNNDGGVWGNDFVDDGIIVLRSTEQNIDGSWNIVSPAIRDISLSEFNKTKLVVGDLIVTKSSGSSLHIGKTSYIDKNVAKMNCTYSNFMQRLRFDKNKDCAKFFFYFLNSYLGRQQLQFNSNTTTGLANLSAEILGNLSCIIPSKGVQKSIASFLDHKTAQIDNLIAEKESLLKLLEEKRIALITQAVTKGLDPNVRMKPSGIDWLGDIPEHWEVKCIKRVVSQIISKIDNDDKIFPYVGLENIESKTGKYLENVDFIPDGIANLFYKSDVLFGKLRPYLAKVYHADFDGSCSTEAFVLRASSKVYSKYLAYYLLTDSVINFIDGSTYGSKMPRANWEVVGSVPISIPSFAEQIAIVEWIEHEKVKIDKLVSIIKEAISKLKEYRISLITAAVTGKIDVRDFTPEEEHEKVH